MNYIVLDMEWNQPYTKEQMVKYPVAISGEIVQIGAVKLDENFSVQDSFNVLIKPKFYKKMHHSISKLTGITNDLLKTGQPFELALELFKDWCGDDFSILTWGDSDVPMLKKNMQAYDLDTKLIPEVYNVQAIFDNQITKLNKPISLLSAMEIFTEPPLDAHNALNDAKNTAVVISHLDMKKGLKDYPNLHNQLVYVGDEVLERCEFHRTYDTVLNFFKDSEVTSFICPECGKINQCIQIVKQSTDKYMSLCHCECGKEVLVRFKFNKNVNGLSSETRLVYQATDEKKELFKRKYEESLKNKASASPKPKPRQELYKLVTKRIYTNRNQAYGDSRIMKFRCNICGSTVTCDKFDAHSSGIRTTNAKCHCGVVFPVKLKFSPKINGKMKLTRIVYRPTKPKKNTTKAPCETHAMA